MTIKDVQNFIFEKSGLKTSVKNGTGSMKGYSIIWPMFQSGTYPSINYKIKEALSVLLIEFNTNEHPLFCSNSEVCIYGICGDVTKFKKEHKPKSIEQMNVREWGSKNSQMRLNKAAERHTKALYSGKNVVRYY